MLANQCVLEEIVMEHTSYQNPNEHKNEHRSIVNMMQWILGKYQSNTQTLVAKTLSLMLDWFDNHINGTDVAFAEFLKGNSYTNEKIARIIA